MSRELGLTLDRYEYRCLRASAPLAPNINHKQTAFGGSLYSVAVLTGWALVNLRLSEHEMALQQRAEVVIYHSEMSYLAGVNQDFHAQATQSAPLQEQRFIQRLLRHGKASCLETIEIFQQDVVKARLSAKYVVLLPS